MSQSRRDTRSIESRILDYLYRIVPDEATPKELARVLKLQHHSVSKTLDAIRRILSGKRIELHGIVLNGICRNANAPHSLATNAFKTYRKRGYYKETFNGRAVSIAVHEMGLVEVECSTSNNR